MLSCFYRSERHRYLRPHCQGVAVVAYGPIALCAMCDAMRSGVGKGMVARALPGAELAQLAEASRTLGEAQQALDRAGRLARMAGASWAQIGDAVGVTRQAAQQRWATPS